MQTEFTITASGLPWRARAGDARRVLAAAQQHGISELLAGVVIGRGVALEDIEKFLNPTLRDYLPDPFHLRDMDTAVARILRAMEQGEPIAIFGDYDVDGATSTALLMEYFVAFGIRATPYIPDRMTEGYGPTLAAFETLITQGAKLILTVDCGTVAHEPIAYAQGCGVDVVVLDHHASSGALPPAHAIVNPNRVDETSPLRGLAAVGVTFLLLVALNARMKGVTSHQPPVANKKEAPLATGNWRLVTPLPNLLSLLDLVALGTVADVMPLTGLNRAFVAQGLKVMAQRRRLGLSLLSDIARMDEAPNTYHLGFLLGPRINAGGRVGKSGLGVELLTAADPEAARGIAATLDLHNQERQAIEADVLEQARAKAATQANLPVILVAGEGWHAGVIGIVAARLKEQFHRPALVVALEAGEGKGSGRSVTGVDMGATIQAAVAEGLLPKGGGHAMAAGFSVEAGKVEALHQFLIARMAAGVAAYAESRTMPYDGLLSVSGANLETLEDISRAGPFGMGNPSPRFVIPRARIAHVAVMKEKHLRVKLADDSGNGRLSAVAFSAVGTKLGEWLSHEKTLNLLGELKVNRWQGQESAQFMIEDAARI